MSDNELLLAISDLLDKKLDSRLHPLQNDIREIKLDIENVIKPQIQLLAENYVPAAKRYEKAASEMEALKADLEIVKKVVAEHSEKLKKLADYFGVSVEYLMGNGEPAENVSPRAPISDEDIKFALFGDRDIDDDVLEEVKAFARFARERKKQKK